MRRFLHNSSLVKIPARYRISISLFVVTVVLWLISRGQFDHYFTFIQTQVSVVGGVMTWVGPHPYVFRYEMWRPILASVLLLVCIAGYSLLRTTAGLFVLAVVLNYLMCGIEVGNSLSVFCLMVFDVGLLWLWARQTSPAKGPPPGFCTNCGYDLRATPERCPECGTMVPFFRKQSEKLP